MNVSKMSAEELQELKERGNEIVRKLHREAIEYYQKQPPPPPMPPPPTIDDTELPESKPDSPLYREWNHYRREVGRLLAEGQEGRFVLIKGEMIIGIWDDTFEAELFGHKTYPQQSFLVHRIQRREPILRGPLRWY